MQDKVNNPLNFVTVPLDQRERKYLKHKWHRRIFLLSTLVTVLVLLLSGILANLFAFNDTINELLTIEVYDRIKSYVQMGLFLPFVIFILHIFNSAKYSATGALASKQQFNHVYAIAEHYSALAGMDYVPNISIVSSGNFMTKSVFNFGKATILVHSDLLDAPRPGSEDWGALRFAIAREIGHIIAGHRTFAYELCTAVTQSIPYLSSPLKRAEAYTADRYGITLAPEAAADYFSVIAVSKDCWADMSIRAAVGRAGQVKLGQLITGIIGDEPPIVWRLQSLARFGIFRVKPLCNRSETVEGYRSYLKKIPTLPISIEDLKTYHAAFWFPPKPITKQELNDLCYTGTNAERLKEIFEEEK